MTNKTGLGSSTMKKVEKSAEDEVMKPSHSSSSIIRETVLSISFLLVFFFSILIFYFTDFNSYISLLQYGNHSHRKQDISASAKTTVDSPLAVEEANGGCDIFSGSWVRDYTRPLYEESKCPHIETQWRCGNNGRPDKDYLYWRWQPHGCSIPSFNASHMLEALRDKRLLFIGDSLNRGQFRSLLCLLHRSTPMQYKHAESIGSLIVFKAKDYNATVAFYWAPFLLESSEDDPYRHSITGKNLMVRNGNMDKHGQHWKGADILVFNTYTWWIVGLKISFRQGMLEDQVKDTLKIPSKDGYRIALKRLVEWINKNINPAKQKVFFNTMSPTHHRSSEWGGDPDGSCNKQTSMIKDPTFFGAHKKFVQIIDEELSNSRFPIMLLNITHLSSARKDAHTSIYDRKQSNLTEQLLAKPDCNHWCLPGLQDIWNELLYAKLFYPQLTRAIG